MNRSRCIILVDGSNFYFKLKDLELNNLLGFDFSGFVKKLAGKAKEKGVLVEYVGFSHKASVAMVAECSESRLLRMEDVEPFLAKV